MAIKNEKLSERARMAKRWEKISLTKKLADSQRLMPWKPGSTTWLKATRSRRIMRESKKRSSKVGTSIKVLQHILVNVSESFLVTLRSYQNYFRAEIARGQLEVEGIQVFLNNYHTSTMDPLFNNFLNGIELQVKCSDQELAESILVEYEGQQFSRDNELICPKCDANEISGPYTSMKDTQGILNFLASIFFSIFPLYLKNVFKCENCAHEFEVSA